jgi:hypothetical protein
MPYNLPPPHIREKARDVQKWMDEEDQRQAQPRPERAIDRFQRLFTARPDVPVAMPAWDPNRKD